MLLGDNEICGVGKVSISFMLCIDYYMLYFFKNFNDI